MYISNDRLVDSLEDICLSFSGLEFNKENDSEEVEGGALEDVRMGCRAISMNPCQLEPRLIRGLFIELRLAN